MDDGKPPPTFGPPVYYRGGRVYYSPQKKLWRVYIRSWDRVEKTVPVDDKDKDTVRKMWNKVLKYIKRDPRPRTR